jgi:hypothetical protein
MPTIIQNVNPERSTQAAVEASDAEYQRVRDGIRKGTSDVSKVTAGIDTQPNSIRLWDCITETWTGFLPKQFVYETYLPRKVMKCSACTYTAVGDRALGGAVKTHVGNVLDQAETHKQAKVVQLSDGTARCSACEASFRSKPMQAQKHIDKIVQIASTHIRVEELFVNQYALEPSEPVAIRRLLVYESDGAETGSVERSAVPRPRGRRRRRSRGRRR